MNKEEKENLINGIDEELKESNRSVIYHQNKLKSYRFKVEYLEKFLQEIKNKEVE